MKPKVAALMNNTGSFFLLVFTLKVMPSLKIIKKPTGFISWLFILYIEYF